VPADLGPLLTATDVSRRFGGLLAVDRVSLSLTRGEVHSVIGTNGAGKSTLVDVLSGEIRASEGSIVFDGEEISPLPAFRRARRGLVRTFQLPSEFAQLTVLENLLAAAPKNRGDSVVGALLGRRYWGADEDALVERARGLLGRFRMIEKENQYAGDLSGGQKRLVEIMRALMLEPRLLLLDEPMAGVHPSIVGEIASYLESLRDEGLTILMVEHQLAIVERLCDPVIVMAQGKVIGRGPLVELRRQREVVDAYLVG